MSEILSADARHCPEDLSTLHFEQVHGMRVTRNGLLSARCPACQNEYSVYSAEAEQQESKDKSTLLNINACRTLARRARVLEHEHYIKYCEARGIPAQGMGGHINCTRDQCMIVIQTAQRNIDSYKAACDPEDTDAEIIRLSKELGIHD